MLSIEGNSVIIKKMLPPAEIKVRAEKLLRYMKKCNLCPVKCGANRLSDEKGLCGVGRHALVSSYGPHFGEEPVLVGRRGSGTVFFAGCSMHCVYCQNYEISQLKLGRATSPHDLADIFLEIQEMGCHNLNLVTPSHVVSQIVEALSIARGRGFDLPVVYNSGGYDRVETLRLLEGIIDIYMPDIKYGDSEIAERYSGVPGYFETAKKAVREMHRQVGDLIIVDGVAVRGLIVRHLVLPKGLASSEKVLKFLRYEISKDTYLNIMDQYYPAYRAFDFPELSRRITAAEYREVVEMALEMGFHRGIPFDFMGSRQK